MVSLSLNDAVSSMEGIPKNGVPGMIFFHAFTNASPECCIRREKGANAMTILGKEDCPAAALSYALPIGVLMSSFMLSVTPTLNCTSSDVMIKIVRISSLASSFVACDAEVAPIVLKGRFSQMCFKTPVEINSG